MPWLSQESYPLPQEDVVTFAFGNTEYDNDKPVRIMELEFDFFPNQRSGLSRCGQRVADAFAQARPQSRAQISRRVSKSRTQKR